MSIPPYANQTFFGLEWITMSLKKLKAPMMAMAGAITVHDLMACPAQWELYPFPPRISTMMTANVMSGRCLRFFEEQGSNTSCNETKEEEETNNKKEHQDLGDNDEHQQKTKLVTITVSSPSPLLW
uniref:Uncharacterized protein n=1 Tax=Oryza glumipatula TaxID=40148 RepID=A0A0D9ZVS3_9ORYZ